MATKSIADRFNAKHAVSMDYGVSPALIGMVKRRKVWKHVNPTETVEAPAGLGLPY